MYFSGFKRNKNLLDMCADFCHHWAY